MRNRWRQPTGAAGGRHAHRSRLEGRRIAALAADGFDNVELVVQLRALEGAGAEVDVASLRRGRIRGVDLHLPATRMGVDRTVGAAERRR